MSGFGCIRASVVLAACLLLLSLAGCGAGSPCDQMRQAQDHVAALERRAADADRHPEDAPGKDELMKAYTDEAEKTDACTASLPNR